MIEVLRTPFGRWLWNPIQNAVTYAERGRQASWQNPDVFLTDARNNLEWAVAAAAKYEAARAARRAVTL